MAHKTIVMKCACKNIYWFYIVATSHFDWPILNGWKTKTET